MGHLESMEACSTCASLLSAAPAYSEKPLPDDRRVACCARVICGKCIQSNRRFAEYCPYCQISSGPSALPQGLRDPPAYEAAPAAPKASSHDTAPPPYTPPPSTTAHVNDEKGALAAAAAQKDSDDAEDTLHFLNHNHDTVSSLSLRYGVPASALRRANNLTSDHLLLGRRTVLIPGAYYKSGVSLSPRPIEGEDEERRKANIRRFMTSTKVSKYEVALLYLEQTDYNLAAAMEAYFVDEAWEKEHQFPGHGKAAKKGKQKVGTNSSWNSSRLP